MLFDLVSLPHRYPLLRFTVHSSYGDYTELPEFQFLVCNRSVSSIEYPETEYSFYKDYEQISISPIQYGFSDCSIQPSLPDGMSIDPNTCIISGVSHSLGSQQYTVTSTMVTPPIQSILNLTFIQCYGSVYKIIRNYMDNPQNEYFTIQDTSNESILYQINSGHLYPKFVKLVHYLCINVDRFDVAFDSTSNYWSSGSYYFMYAMLPDGEQEMVVKGRYDSYQGNIHTHYLRRPSINHSEQWYYKMGEVPTNWFGDDTSGWSQAARGSFPTSTNRIQLYKKTFNIASLNEVSGLIVSIRYRYGVIVYLNGNEAWRNGVIGDLSTSSTVDNSYTDLKYYVVTLPGKQMQTSTVTTPVTFLQSGSNTIAIAIVAITDSYTTSYFDTVVRLMSSEQSESHIWEFTSSMSGISGYSVYPFDMYYDTRVSSSSCESKNLIVTFSNDRGEWIVLYQYVVTEFVLYGRNSDTDEWTLLRNVTGLTYSTVVHRRRIYFPNNTPYNQLKFEKFSSGNRSSCSWVIQSVDLFADNVLVDIPNFTYDSSMTIFKDMKMTEVAPQNTEEYLDFRISTVLPAGIVLDANTGWISGTPTVVSTTQTYTITGTKMSGGDVSATLTLTVLICSGDKGMMRIRFYGDDYPNNNSWKLYEGRGTSGTVLQSVSEFRVFYAYFYVDFCLNNGIYRFEGANTSGYGWFVGSGYTLTVDLGEMELDMMQMDGQDSKPILCIKCVLNIFPFPD
ncbi:hypothetical protein WA171_002112 [Blastocystis sp. BT1]